MPTSYPGRVHTASTTASAARCCRKGILWPRAELMGMRTCRVNMAHPSGLSQALPPRPESQVPGNSRDYQTDTTQYKQVTDSDFGMSLKESHT